MDINWATGEITVYKTDPFMTFVGGSVYNMDTNGFRLALKDREDDPIGMVYPDTHNHNTTVLLGGIEYARIVEILAPYTITFNDTGGGWVCNLIGSNNNILDRTNLTTVQVRSNNSAGLIQTQELEHASFNGCVTVDVTDGVAGTIYPIGTTRRPVNNMADAKLIAQVRGLETIHVDSSCTFDGTVDLDGFNVFGMSEVRTAVNILSAANVQNCTLMHMALSGVLDGDTVVERCSVNNLTYVNGLVMNSMLNPATITLGGDSSVVAHFINCTAGKAGGPIIDCAGDGPSLMVRSYNGSITLVNKTGTAPVVIDLNSGKVVLDDTVVAGHIIVRGLGELVDITGNVIPSGAWNGCTIDNDTVTSNADIASAVIAAAQAAPIYADTRKMNGATVTGTGTSGDKWRGV